MKTLKKLSIILMATGVFMILGKMGESDMEVVAVTETLRGVAQGGLVLCLGKVMNMASALPKTSGKNCEIIPYSKGENLAKRPKYKRAV